ncbi:hypothetical protein FUAX_22370 [Fulvitalea axinellae]|uniref:YHS domain-containing protein n=1 Tax=Fulvitalea axinellae TaxID=1182444 RepID=A0AAU9DFQ1_9BACT|nr:hypothetical protein FUAX_22370 [Fulvitalea axinellae]
MRRLNFNVMARGYILIGILLYLVVGAHAQNVKDLNLDDGVMAKGYDVVAYFQNKAVKGKSSYKFKYQGAVYKFSSSKNLEEFKQNPHKYVPQYGGWCAYAMGEDGKKVDINPSTYEILDGKLYLFYNRFFNNTKEKWDKDPEGYRKKADRNWDEIIKKN